MSRRSRVFAAMIVSMMLGYLPWYNFSAVLNYIAGDFALSSYQVGVILSAFQVGYIMVVIISGWLADRAGERRVVFWATLATAVFSTAFAFLSRGFWSIAVLRLLTGLSAGAIYVPGMVFLSRWFPPGERGKAIGAYTGALTAAYAGGYFIAGPLASAYSWQVGILLTSLPAFAAAFVVLLFTEEPPREFRVSKPPPQPDVEEDVQPAPAGGFAGPVAISCGYMGHMWELYAFWGWVGPFMTACALQSGYGADAAAVGGRLAALIIISGAPAVYLMGRAADKWGRTATIMLCSLLSLGAQFAFGFMYGHPLAAVTILGFWIGFWTIADSGIYKAGLTEMVAGDIRGRALGIQSAAGYCMTAVSPYVFGLILHMQNPGVDNPVHAENWSLPFIILGAGALLAPLSAVVLRRLKQARLMANGRR